MSPPVPGTLWRELPVNSVEDHVVIDGHVIPRGTLVGVNTYAIHHNEVYFKDPFEFIPERWSLENEMEQAGSDRTLFHSAFAPFSVGTRSCVGKRLAEVEMLLVVAKILWYFDFEVPAEEVTQSENTLVGKSRGKVGKNEFQIYDQLIATHYGPYLRFQPTRNP